MIMLGSKVSRSKFWPPVSGRGIRVSSTFSPFGYLAEGECWEAKQDSYHWITSLAVQEAPLNNAPVVEDGYNGNHLTQKYSSGTLIF
jgi:hypothetical protein